ncbi:MAG TPA: undecaprenyl diphosphate synthase family protein, partial [Candidatus Acidoferrum sp.]|nr:undecaprenyl diphosphate synthase family protein [Candidatus Acidoferrum sp.]
MLVHNPVLAKTVLHPRPYVPAAASQLHVAIICDGNGRWATARALPRSTGHRAGAEAARRVIRSAPHLGIHTLTLFALSSANWKRPPAEVAAILEILQEYLLAETSHCL